MSGQVTRAMQLVLNDSLVVIIYVYNTGTTMNVVHKHLFATITNCMKSNDSNLNKKNPNLVDTRLEHLHVRTEYEENLPGSRKELSKLNDFSTPLEHLQCLKHVVTFRTRLVEAAKSEDTLHLAALYVQEGLIDILSKNGCLADASDVLGRTALHMAALKGHQNIISKEYNGFLYDEMQGVVLVSSTLLAMDKKKKPFTRRPCIATFKISGFDCALVSVYLKATGLENEDIGRLQAEIDNIPNLIEAIRTALPGENDIILLGDFNLSPVTKDFDDLRNQGYHNCIADGVFTNISDANKKGSKTYDNIWISKQTKQVFTGQCDVVREGLSSPWIPKGWTWGGVVSDHCPVWAQFYTGRDLDTGDLKIGPEAIKFALTD
ncbi:endonuclease/exonuclease/phosphatase family domain-containing protein 1-like [Dreissena polymorpha]|uniref:endonuclease/exonuclease/phosphatase family domain-containing protein 1-like n=1 Tax=Dreissena polymorpha TaxID=45954 RepID=UPI002263E5C8|nr:endonuclease/exonuclease/phosphatase family domain-containing protein 1-like [Dreissena polymorpha]